MHLHTQIKILCVCMSKRQECDLVGSVSLIFKARFLRVIIVFENLCIAKPKAQIRNFTFPLSTPSELCIFIFQGVVQVEPNKSEVIERSKGKIHQSFAIKLTDLELEKIKISSCASWTRTHKILKFWEEALKKSKLRYIEIQRKCGQKEGNAVAVAVAEEAGNEVAVAEVTRKEVAVVICVIRSIQELMAHDIIQTTSRQKPYNLIGTSWYF